MIRISALLISIFLAAHDATGAQAIVGRASVIDGDTLEIHGTRIRLHGIDAPESGQSCTAQGRQWNCGQRAAYALSVKIGFNPIACDPKDRDRYGRVVAVCRSGNLDLNAWMVAEGWALAYRQYSTDYVPNERNASAARRGIWQGEFTPPWEWRQGQRNGAPRTPGQSTQPAQACQIKGNISSRGERIYHVPGGQYYGATRIDPSKGERMFCSEAEAQAAGWRRSLR
jgi:endonuclease YncB( thermonuclease family)